MAEKDIEKLCLKERVDLSDKKKQEQSGLQMRKRDLYLLCWTGRMCCLGSSRVLGGSLAWLRGGRVGRRQFTSSKRSPEECKKKYNNAKERSMFINTIYMYMYLVQPKRNPEERSQEHRWGQVELELTEAEEVLLERQEGRPRRRV
uniref:Uncharacterized protein n=1 Tax=Magallana gigas TaxID=29159 RepID=A0A8W8MI04_MAGGI